MVSTETKRADPVHDEVRAGSERALLAKLAPYRDHRLGRSLLEVAITVIPFVALWLAMWLARDQGLPWLALLLAVPTAAFLIRLFMLQHDCGHGSLFPRRAANDAFGRLLSLVTLTPYDHWRAKHAVHHATAGNLDRRGDGDIETLTVREFHELGRRERIMYRLMRHPFVIMCIAPVYLFVVRYRLPGDFRDGWRAWLSTMATNACIVGVLALLAWLIGGWELFMIQAPVTLVAASAGVWLFYVQHQFEHTTWERNPDWSFHEGALYGSSYLDLPPVLRWFTANIGLHHVHHLCSRIPSYRLPEVLRDFPELGRINRLTLAQALGSLHLALWDEDTRTLIGFRELSRRAHPSRPAASKLAGQVVAPAMLTGPLASR